ncbi:MAG: tellurite resistance/C4-dicarboxylate transporter family protein [Candidatus Rokubacteria bacterium]|nr:tellurite resistance/C4-dicarboxylate transporter family protein [Candidatus Rokubacteria bacterium]
MATGIVSIAAYRLDLVPVAWTLLAINLVAYAVLWLLTVVRLIRHFPRVLADLGDHTRGAGFFTAVAGSCVLARQIALLTGAVRVPLVLGLVGAGLWLVLMYAFLLAVMVRSPKPPLQAGLNGGWLVIVVATQSIAVLGATLAGAVAGWREPVLFLALVMYLLGCMLYVVLISLIFYRLTFFALAPEALTPPYWINMGALAITTLAGATLIAEAAAWPFLRTLVPFLTGLTLLFWATGTWWIPLLVALGLWRHVARRLPVVYEPAYWSLVFPVGMYTASTWELERALGTGMLAWIPRYVVYIALVAWTVTFIGLLRRLARGVALRTLAGAS